MLMTLNPINYYSDTFTKVKRFIKYNNNRYGEADAEREICENCSCAKPSKVANFVAIWQNNFLRDIGMFKPIVYGGIKEWNAA